VFRALIPFVCLVLFPLLGECQRYTFREYGQAEGLSNLTVNSIEQDRQGFIWAATQNGVFRYDGFRFERYPLDPGLQTHNIQTLHEDSFGRLWVAVENGVGFYQGRTLHLVRNHGKDLNMTAGSVLSSAPDGRVFAASDGMLFELNKAASGDWDVKRVPVATNKGALRVESVLWKTDGSLMLGCADGVCQLGPSGLRVWGAPEGLKKDTWTGLLSAPNGDLWVRGLSHVAVLRRGSAKFTECDLPGNHGPKDDNFTLAVDAQGRILTVTGRSVARRDGDQWTLIDGRQGLPLFKLTSVFVDARGGVSVIRGTVVRIVVSWASKASAARPRRRCFIRQ
jgi:ligand-binding sensor domain-containing protein